jgi:hypothetical protein
MRLLVSLEPVGENGLLEIVLIAVEIAGGVDDPVVVEVAEEAADGVDDPVAAVVDAVATADLDTKKTEHDPKAASSLAAFLWSYWRFPTFADRTSGSYPAIASKAWLCVLIDHTRPVRTKITTIITTRPRPPLG